MIYRVSHLASYARWRDEEDIEIDWLINQILSNEETEAMRKGTAFHKAMEHMQAGVPVDEFTQDGYTFVFTGDFSVYLPPMREWRQQKDYGGIIVSGQCDGIIGGTIVDHKTTEYFDAEKYLQGWQHKFYMDIFGADRFVWNIWEMKQDKDDSMEQDKDDSMVYEVRNLHPLTQYRYPEMEQDCRNLAQEFREFAEKHLAQFQPKPIEPTKQVVMKSTNGHNVLNVGWLDGILYCEFGGGRQYKFFGVPEEEFGKLLRSPFPDKLFISNIKGKFTSEKIA